MAVNPNIPENKFRGSSYVPLEEPKTNKYFAASNAEFKKACSNAGVTPSIEHARRWKQKIGKVWQAAQQAKDEERLAKAA